MPVPILWCLRFVKPGSHLCDKHNTSNISISINNKKGTCSFLLVLMLMLISLVLCLLHKCEPGFIDKMLVCVAESKLCWPEINHGLIIWGLSSVCKGQGQGWSKLPFGCLFVQQIVGSSSIKICLKLWLDFFHVVLQASSYLC